VTIIGTTRDPEALTLTLVTELAASPARVWQVWSDPRQLERWWGPPTWPATFEQHDFVVGGRASYYMTGPEGQKSRGWWQFLNIDEPRSLEFEDGFADEAGTPNTEMPTIYARIDLSETDAGTRMTVMSRFGTVEQMEKLVEMGMVEGMTLAMNQIDAILASTRTPA
jgi:uncharacterized protein YndB with AHSA1/START domain